MTAEALAAGSAVGSGTPLQYLPRALRVPERPLVAILVGWLTAFPLSMVLAVAGAALMPDAPRPEFQVDTASHILPLVIFAPVVETLAMGLVLLVLLRFVSAFAAVAVSAVGWGILHSLLTPIWGLVIWWPFLVFSLLFVTWIRRSWTLGFGIPMAVHGLQNLIPALMLLATSSLAV